MMGMPWFVLLCCGLLLSAGLHHHTLVRAQFAANPLVLSADNVLLLNGITANGQSGVSVSGVGDVNGDGVQDFVVGAHLASPEVSLSTAGQVYLLFGHNASVPWAPGVFDLATLDGSNGVTFNGALLGNRDGFSVAGVQDVNGDGCNDVLIGTQEANAAYLVFGVNGTWPSVVSLDQGMFNGVTFVGDDGDRTGNSVCGAGDVNNDGVPDVAIGIPMADTPGGTGAGRMDVLYGRGQGAPWPDVVTLSTYVNVSTGFSVLGGAMSDECGTKVSGLGDVNGDGVDDVGVSCPAADPNGVDGAGLVAVVFGASTHPNATLPSQLMNGTRGFVVNGHRSGGAIGSALSAIGDVNADGLPDFAIGAPAAKANAVINSGEAYLLFGRNATAWPAQVDLSSLRGNNGSTLGGSDTGDTVGKSVSAAGDVNMDGIDDVLVGATGASIRGSAFLLYGRAVWPASQSVAALNGINSATFQGDIGQGSCGTSVSLVGDVNSDGRGDLAVGCPGVNAGQTAIVFGPLFTAAPTTASPTRAPTTAVPTTTTSPTTAPTATTCDTEGAFIPPGATCENGVLITNANTTAPPDTAVVSSSVTITGGASFEQPSGSTLVFVAGSSGGSTSIVVEGGGCATIAGNAVVSFDANPLNGGGASGNTGTLVLVTADCVMGAFGSVGATTSFEGDECVAIGDGEQQTSGNSISVSFAVSNTCDSKSNALSTGALVGLIVGGSVVAAVLVIVAVKLALRARYRRAAGSLHQSLKRQTR